VDILMTLEFSQQIFEKYSCVKFHENSSSRSRVVACGQTDRHDELNNSFSQFCERDLLFSRNQQMKFAGDCGTLKFSVV
jgi:hypothetical protein